MESAIVAAAPFLQLHVAIATMNKSVKRHFENHHRACSTATAPEPPCLSQIEAERNCSASPRVPPAATPASNKSENHRTCASHKPAPD